MSQNACHQKKNPKCFAAALSFCLLLTACGEDEPFLYFVSGPTLNQDKNGRVQVSGELWSVIPWPAGSEFCVTATWEPPYPPGTHLLLDQVCASAAVPESELAEVGFPFTLRAAEAVAAPAPGAPPWTLSVGITSEHHGNREEYVSATLTVPAADAP